MRRCTGECRTDVLIEYQNDFVEDGGALHEGVQTVMKSSDMLANSLRLVKGPRAQGVTILRVPISFAEG